MRRLSPIAVLLLAGCPFTEPTETPSSPDASVAPQATPDATVVDVATATQTEVPVDPDPVEPDPVPANDHRPEWVRQGTRAEGEVYYGLGKVRGIRNRSLARSTADNRARAAVGRLLSGKGSFTGTLSGVEIEKRWYDRKTRTHYSLARYAP